MLVKNVSNRIIRFEDFPLERPLLPGGVVDLSKYSPAQREGSRDLKDAFDKGELVCMGYATSSLNLKGKTITKTSLNPMQKYEIKPEEFSVNKPIIPKKQLQPAVNASSLSRRDHIQKNPTVPERYNTEALAKYKIGQNDPDQMPEFTEKDFKAPTSHSFVQLQDEDQVITVSIDETTNTTYASDLQPGVISTKHLRDPSVFIDDTPYTEESMEDPAKLNAANRQREILKAKLEKKIIALVEGKCLSPKQNGRPCDRPVLKGYGACFEHLSRSDKAKYIEEQQNAKKTKSTKA